MIISDRLSSLSGWRDLNSRPLAPEVVTALFIAIAKTLYMTVLNVYNAYVSTAIAKTVFTVYPPINGNKQQLKSK